MNAIVKSTNPNADIMESVLADGDLSRLTSEQRVRYYLLTCQSVGLNPYTRPFDYIRLNGKLVLYAKRDCTDQLRKINCINITIIDKKVEDELYVVTVRASTAQHREDEDVGAVTITGLKGEARANAMLKAVTKAKRRVTLSICGMGMAEESEVEAMHGAVVESVSLPPQAPEIPTLDEPPKPKRGFPEWLAEFKLAADACEGQAEFEELCSREEITRVTAKLKNGMKEEFDQVVAMTLDRFDGTNITGMMET